MKRILVQNNFYILPTFDLNECEILFAPKYFSKIQFDFYKKRFHELTKICKKISWVDSVEENDFDITLSWNAIYEKRAFGLKIDQRQNRLFSTLPFKLPQTFTPFRQLAERYLPASFDEAIIPWDQEIRQEFDYYFREKKLPLTYLETRNEMTGRDGSTKFSSYLSSGFLDVRFLFNEVREFELNHGATKSSGWIIFELLWREFFYWHYQSHERAYFSKYGLKSYDFSRVESYEADQLKSMRVHPFFNAALNELTTTGFLSNRARQIFASIWINDLQLDWRSGAELFEHYLIDYDVYSNYGNWMYLAGVGVDPRGKRYFNVNKQLETYDPQGSYLKMWG